MPRAHLRALHARSLSATEKLLLGCGPLASLLYIVWNDVIAAARWEGYNRTTQAISELSSLGAPSRGALVPWFNLTYSALMVAFGTAVWRSGHGRKELRAAGAQLVAYGLSGPLWLPFPMSMRHEIAAGTSDAVADVGHLVMSGVSLVLWLGTLWSGGRAFGKSFRLYSLVTAAGVLLFGGLTGVQSNHIAAGEPTPWLGVVERAMFGVFFVWMVVLAGKVSGRPRDGDAPAERVS
jgi:hypothetical protein